ncbi:hypothetical protein PR003_g2025 [Phytophthora rubi]|uniref:Uncharacterized protein n=1 Tax=Phytophthora rubi TaxID=129364 RepID=A0A6A4FTV9_9STRA|nr:hypothetical protein PR001_g5201 [Phytophthora rubi]KAE9356983.1 hypothetical protein PR003_g2025 [Phytophthora rubi]
MRLISSDSSGVREASARRCNIATTACDTNSNGNGNGTYGRMPHLPWVLFTADSVATGSAMSA